MEMTVQSYFAAVPSDRIEMVEALHNLILFLCPTAVVTMRYKMPTYEVGDAWVSLANQKYYVSLYLCGSDHVADFGKRHPQIKTGKGCVRFKPNVPLPLDEVKTLIRQAMNNPKSM